MSPLPSLLAFLAGFLLWSLLALLSGIRAWRKAERMKLERASAELIPIGRPRPRFLPAPRLVQRVCLLLPHHEESP